MNRYDIALVLFLLNFTILDPSVAQDSNEGVWTEVSATAPWEARAGLQAVYLNDQLYVMGGRTPSPPGDPVIPGESTIWQDVWSSDDMGITWTQQLENDSNAVHWSGRAYFQAVTLGEYMYILGGQNFKTVPNPDCDPPFTDCSPFISTSDFFNDVWRSVDGINWEMMTDNAGWSGRAGFSCVVFENELYVMAGSINDDVAIVGGPPSRIYLNDVWKSSDGSEWELLTEAAPWKKRAGGIASVKDGYIYMIGGEEGFVCLPGTPCPPYFNDVWKSNDGINWEEVTPQAPWKKRPGHQVVVLDNTFYLFGGFGLSEDLFDPFAVNNPRDLWASDDGADWVRISRRPWNALTQEEIKYDFDAISVLHPETGNEVAFTFGGDRETFDFTDPLNYLNVDNDVWTFCPKNCSILTASSSSILSDASIEIYPLPATDLINLEFEALESSVLELTISDVSGKQMMASSLNVNFGNNVIREDISALAQGIYILKLSNDKGSNSMRLIKH